ncbi:LOW QUALITY PROTEIN: BPI fold-containing family C protein-like [Acridotheres tristis]
MIGRSAARGEEPPPRAVREPPLLRPLTLPWISRWREWFLRPGCLTQRGEGDWAATLFLSVTPGQRIESKVCHAAASTSLPFSFGYGCPTLFHSSELSLSQPPPVIPLALWHLSPCSFGRVGDASLSHTERQDKVWDEEMGMKAGISLRDVVLKSEVPLKCASGGGDSNESQLSEPPKFLQLAGASEISKRLKVNSVGCRLENLVQDQALGRLEVILRNSIVISRKLSGSCHCSKGQGGIAVSISGQFIAVILEVSGDSTDYLSVLLHSCQLSTDSVKVNEGSSRIYSLLSGYLEKPIHTKLDKNTDTFAQVDCSLVSSSAVFQPHVNLDLKGAVYPVGNHTDLPFVPAPFAPPNQSDSTIYLGVSNFPESPSLAYYRAGAFNITISEEIAQSYTAAGPVLLRLMATSPAAVSLNAGRCVLQITGCVEVFAVLPNSTTQYIFAGNLVTSTRANLTISKQKLIISLLLKRTIITQKSLVENFLSYALHRIVIPVTSDKLGKVFPLLNLVHTSLTGPVIKMNQGHLVICTDVCYQLEDEEDLHSHC